MRRHAAKVSRPRSAGLEQLAGIHLSFGNSAFGIAVLDRDGGCLSSQVRRSWSMSDTAADVLVETLMDWGVQVVFGLPGDGINGIIEALRTRQDKIRFVQVRHEESAAFMACGYAKWTGRLGCCLAT